MGKLGIFDESAGLNATVGIGYSLRKPPSEKTVTGCGPSVYTSRGQ